MLAVKRMANVIGRIIFLKVSINTIKNINIKGVPRGTKCLNIKFVLLIQPKNISPIHIDKENNKEKGIWLELVKMYGNSPIRLLVIILINKLIKINKLIVLNFQIRISLNSAQSFIKIKNKNFNIREGVTQ